MRKLVLSIFSISLSILISGCLAGTYNPNSAKINYNLPSIDSAQVRHISNISSISFEWNMIRNPAIKGYAIYRSGVNDKKLRKIATINDRYSTHFVDKNLKANSIYLYQFSSIGQNGIESQKSDIKAINTIMLLDSVPYSYALSNLPRRVKIIWRPHPSQLINKYLIYKIINNKWRKIGEVSNRLTVEYIDTNLKDNATYSYRVYAMTFDNIASKAGPTLSAKTKPLPDRVTQVLATKNLPKKIDVSWSTREEDIAYFNIYRSSNIQSGFQIIKQTNEERFADRINQDGVIYFYKISITDTDGLESQTIDTTGTLGQTIPKPSTPIISYIKQINKQKITIKWESQDNRTVSYVLVRKYKNNQVFMSMGIEQTFKNIGQTEFIDTNIMPDSTYTYHVYGVDKFGISSLKSQKSIVVTPKLKL